MGAWGVICRPTTIGHVAGLAVVITDEEHEHVIGHIAFVRPKSINPNVSFEQQLQIVLDKADEVVTTLTELQDVFVAQQQEAERTVDKAIDEFRRLMNEASSDMRKNVRVAVSDALGKAMLAPTAQ